MSLEGVDRRVLLQSPYASDFTLLLRGSEAAGTHLCSVDAYIEVHRTRLRGQIPIAMVNNRFEMLSLCLIRSRRFELACSAKVTPKVSD